MALDAPTAGSGSIRRRRGALALLLALPGWALTATPAGAETDLCGCAGSPASHGDFRSVDENTYPPGTMRNGTTITLPLPEDGRLVFDSFVLNGVPDNPTNAVTIRFTANAANDPVRLLVAGDVTVPANGSTIDVSGSPSAGSGVDPRDGLAGPGGFRGGDGALEQTTLTRTGGYGLGPGGGAPGVANVSDRTLDGRDATFVGNNELIPLIGGGGGGGGSTSASSCAGGGGGGGGGALLIVANGTLTMNGFIMSNGAYGASPSFCGVTQAGYGGGGSAGAIRLVADTIAGNGNVYAQSYTNGIIRLEAFDISPNLNTAPVATRSFAPTAEGQFPRLAISDVNGETESRINGEPIAERPQGVFGGVDVVVSGADPVTVHLASSGLTSGTGVQVWAKRRTGGERVAVSATLGSCTAEGNCTATAVFNALPAGNYFIEAKATFQ